MNRLSFSKSDYNIPRTLSLNKDISVTKPDKGSAALVSNCNKTLLILNDCTNFGMINEPTKQPGLRLKDKVLANLRLKRIINNDLYVQLYSCGSGLPKSYCLNKLHKFGASTMSNYCYV